MAFMLTCKEAHRITSESLDRELTLMERTRLRAHVMLCDACHNFSNQMQLIRKTMDVLDHTHQPRASSSKDETWQ